MSETVKTLVRREVEEAAEVELPLYGEWDDDADDGRVTWQTRFKIGADGVMHSVTRWRGDSNKWEYEADIIDLQHDLGGFLKYPRISAERFEQALADLRRAMPD